MNTPAPRTPHKSLTKGSNPKIAVMRQVAGSLAVTARRSLAEITRAQPSPKTAQQLRDDLAQNLTQFIRGSLNRSGLPVVTSAEPVPQGAHWLFDPMAGLVNARHGRLPCSCAFAFVEDDGTCKTGAVYFPVEDVMVVAEAGQGSSGGTNNVGGTETTGRFRVAGRTELADTMMLLPWNTADVINLKLLEKAAPLGMHTRKTGHTMFDVIDVAAGRADTVVATRLSRIEALLAPLILTESGAFATELTGGTLTVASTSLLAANPKLHGQLLKLVNASASS